MLIYGKQVAADTRAKLKDDVKSFEEKYGRKPSLAVIIVGEDPASQTYVKNKI
ncbi:MAG TPA: bifunctional 5,10-methylene-tetrahydrofolate dehydrogenase/5,10-methylene-tetrahydrofolate cyclohydrolase, partial [Candidatus Ornithoclostridium faecavium]|nr:bifunctional 5,10-methylene-tetrahydrofolate dehydrogenase/5,10-methylene-tetrahydrofolate cyclohydrolase [Candidatus Ornithoclostridium faecavium]